MSELTNADDRKWLDAISNYERDFNKWEKRAENIVKRYRDFDQAQDSRQSQTTTFNILWSNVQVLLPATFARLPQPDVSRRFRDDDPVGRVASLILERGLSYEVENYPDYRAAMTNCVLDRFLGGRGTAWVRYDPKFEAQDVQITDSETQDDELEDGEEAPVNEVVTDECSPTDYVHWKDFGHTAARTWEEVTAVWRRVYMGREALEDRFPDNWQTIPMDVKGKDSNGKLADGTTGQPKQACIYEIWDKVAQEAIWFSRGAGVLDRRPDPLRLQGFFPCPRPLYSTLTTDSLVPVPDYKIYQDQAAQLNKLADRIDGLITMLQVKGVYDASIPELARLFKEAGNGDLIAVKSFAGFAEKSGLSGSIDIFDLAPIVGALNECYAGVDAVKNEIYELMGISDIVRGASDPGETYGAQKLKGIYGNMRLRAKQQEVAQFATELLQLKAQVICQNYQPETIARIAAVQQLSPEDQQLVPQAIQLLIGDRNNPESYNGPLSAFRVEVSSDSLVYMDEQQEKTDRMEFLKAVGEYMVGVMPLAQASPQLAPLLAGLLKFGVTGFKVGKTVEGMIDAALEKMTQAAAQPQEPKPDPEVMKVQAQMQGKMAEIQAKGQADQVRIQAEAQLEASRQNSQAQEQKHTQELEAQRARFEAQLEAQLESQRQQNAKEIEGMKGQIALAIASMNNETKMRIAAQPAQHEGAE